MLIPNGEVGKELPTYTIKEKKTGKQREVVCSHSELIELLEKNPDLEQGLAAPRMVSGTKDVRARTPDGFKDVLSRIKSGSGKSNTVKY